MLSVVKINKYIYIYSGMRSLQKDKWVLQLKTVKNFQVKLKKKTFENCYKIKTKTLRVFHAHYLFKELW